MILIAVITTKPEMINKACNKNCGRSFYEQNDTSDIRLHLTCGENFLILYFFFLIYSNRRSDISYKFVVELDIIVN